MSDETASAHSKVGRCSGCGSVGSPGGAAADRAGRRPGRPGRVRPSSWSASPYAASTRRARSTCPTGLLTTDAAGLVARDDVDVVIEVIGGIEPARSLILSALEQRRERRHRQQGAARRGRPDALRGRREGRPRPLLRGRGGRRHPDPAAAARVAGRRQGDPGARHRQRHHELHPRQDGHLRRRLRRGARGGPGARATPRPTRPPTSRASTPPPRPRSWPAWPSTPGSPPPTSTARASPRSPPPTSQSAREMGSVVKLLAICELRRDPTATTGRRAGAPGDDPARHPLASVRGAYNAVFVESEAAGQLMFYGPGAGGAPTASAVLGDLVTVARNRLAGTAAPASRPTPSARCCRWGRPAPATTWRSTSTTARACSPRSPTRSPSTTCRSRPSARRAAAPTPSSSSSPTRPPTPRSARPSSSCAAWTSSARSPR